ncbi:hypothetical protein KR038_001633, partial [Drosophila bunnanda]
MQVFCLLLGLIYFLSPAQGQEVEDYDFDLPKGFARSVINMDELLHLEDDLALNLEQYIEALTQKANTIRMGIQEMVTRHQHRLGPVLKLAWNPFNSYSLIRHMQADWMMWQLYMNKPVGQERLDYLNSKMQEMPQDSDFQDAAEGIRRIQAVYQMSASDIADGLLDGVQYNASLTARDCLEMGRYLMNQSLWDQAKEWINAGIMALNRVDPQPAMQELMGTSKTELLATLRQVLVKLHDSEAALTAYQHALKESSYDAELYQEFLLAEMELLTKPVVNDSQLDDSSEMIETIYCCSGRCELPRELQLYCLYNTTASPFLILAPIKMEILSLDPYIVLFHDVVSHQNMQKIRTGTKSHLIPSSTYNPRTHLYSVAPYRMSKSVWLQWDMNNATMEITTMLKDATALNMNRSEMFQVMNYGVGGLFRTHIDVLLADEVRISQFYDFGILCFQLSEVKQGGGTIFPYLNLTVFPQQGSVLFWYNLDTAGNEEPYVAHAGCPVIVGSKWVMSKWIEDIGQEFNKPC